MSKRWIINIIDESGSMDGIKHGVIQEYNNFIKYTRESNHDCNVDIRWTTFFFNDVVREYQDEQLEHVLNLTPISYRPINKTALLDAVGTVCNRIISNTVEYTSICVNIFTDGKENCSSAYTYRSVNDLIGVIKMRNTLALNFYCTTEDCLDFTKQIPKLDNSFSGSFNECVKQMSKNSNDFYHLPHGSSISEPSTKRHKNQPVSLPKT
jgi:hypothetical protein